MRLKIFTTTFAMMVISSFAFAQLAVPPTGASLNAAIDADTASDGSRNNDTYILERAGYYVLTGAINVTGDLTLKSEDGTGMRPIIVMGTDDEGVRYPGNYIVVTGDLTLNDLRLTEVDDLGNRGKPLFSMPNGDTTTITIDNCLIDFFDGFITGWGGHPGQSLYLTNNIFRWNGDPSAGAIWAGFGPILKNAEIEKIYIENNTYVDCIAPMLIFENANLKNYWFNHNTIVNHGQYLMRSEYWNSAIFMNNLFVNAHFLGETAAMRDGQDPQGLPYGVITVMDTVSSSWTDFPAEDERVMLVAHNNNFVGAEIKQWWADAPSLLPGDADFQVANYTKGDNGFLNSRATAIMADDAKFPYFLWDNDFSMAIEDPVFNGYTFDYVGMRQFAEKTVGVDTASGSGKKIGDYGQHPTSENNSVPVAADHYTFDYSNKTLQGAGYEGYPLGDLNWWPGLKATWMNDSKKETYDAILASVLDKTWEFKAYDPKEITGINYQTSDASGINLGNSFPNPATDFSKITFSISNASFVSLKLYNMLGQEVLNVLEEQYSAGSFETEVNVTNLSSGTYFYKLQVNGHSQTSKLILL